LIYDDNALNSGAAVHLYGASVHLSDAAVHLYGASVHLSAAAVYLYVSSVHLSDASVNLSPASVDLSLPRGDLYGPAGPAPEKGKKKALDEPNAGYI